MSRRKRPLTDRQREARIARVRAEAHRANRRRVFELTAAGPLRTK